MVDLSGGKVDISALEKEILPCCACGAQLAHACCGLRRKKQNVMKIKNSIKTLKTRHRDNRVVRRRGRLYVINKTQRRFKARQG